MRDRDNMSRWVEDALAELEAAETAGVFQPTRLDAEPALVGLHPVATSAGRVFRLWVPSAAAALVVLGVWGLLFRSEVKSIQAKRDRVAQTVRVASALPVSAFAGCLTGPNQLAASSCDTNDLDADGDVDLADFSMGQLADASFRR